MKERFLIIAIVLIALVANQRWITNFSILTHGDWYYQNLETLRQFLTFPHVWNMNSLGFIEFSISFYPFNFLSGLLAQQGFSYGIIERLVFMWPIIMALPVFSYLLIKKNINNSLAAFVGSLVYSYNTYFSVIKTGQLTLLMAYAFAPLVFLLFQKALEKKSFQYALFTGLFGFVVSFYEFRIFYVLCFILFAYFLYYLLFIEKVRNLSSVIKICFFAGIPVLIDLLLNLYWLLPLGKTGALSSNVVFDRSLFGNEFLNINYAMTLFHPFWTGTRTAIFTVQNIPVYFWLIPLFAFLGLILNKKNKQILFFGLIALLGIFLTKQVGHPFMDVYLWLYTHFPGFNAFREASKFYFLIALGYSVLIAGFIDWLWKNWKNTKWQILGKYALAIVIAAIFLWNTKPFITGEIATLFIPREMSADYLVVNNFLLKQNDYFRTLWIPVSSRWAVYTNIHPAINVVDMINGTWSGFIKSKRNDKITEAELTKDVLTFPKANNLLDMTSIKYVIVPVEDKANDDDFFVSYGKSRQYYISELNKISYLHKIDIETKEIAVYENENFKPHIYLTSEKETIQKDVRVKSKDIRYEFVNPTEYKISLTNIAGPTYLNFSEVYHPSWKIFLGDFKWYNVLLNKQESISDKNHFQNDASLNSYVIDPSAVCNDNVVLRLRSGLNNSKSCIKNPDGSYDIDMTLYFAPQSYTYLGLIVSGGTLIVVVGYLFFALWRTNYVKRKK